MQFLTIFYPGTGIKYFQSTKYVSKMYLSTKHIKIFLSTFLSILYIRSIYVKYI